VLASYVGTNAGKSCWATRQKVLGLFLPTGPAFEGARSAAANAPRPGAIERVEIDPVTKIARFKVDRKATCGLIDPAFRGRDWGQWRPPASDGSASLKWSA